MDPLAAKYIAQGMIILSMIGSAIGEAIVIKGAFDAIGRNPQVADKLLGRLLIFVALVESTAIYAFVAFIILLFA